MNPTDGGYAEWIKKMMAPKVVSDGFTGADGKSLSPAWKDVGYTTAGGPSVFRGASDPEWGRYYYGDLREPSRAIVGPGQRRSDYSTHVHMSVPRQNGKDAIFQMIYGADAAPTHIHTAIYDNKENTMNRTEVITNELARLQNELSSRNVYGEDTHAEGDVLRFKANFNGEQSFTYAAIKAGGKWHLTGSRSDSNLTWSQLVDFFIRSNATKVWQMTKGERIV